MIDELLSSLDKAKNDLNEPNEVNGIMWIVGGIAAMAIGAYVVSKAREIPKEASEP